MHTNIHKYSRAGIYTGKVFRLIETEKANMTAAPHIDSGSLTRHRQSRSPNAGFLTSQATAESMRTILYIPYIAHAVRRSSAAWLQPAVSCTHGRWHSASWRTSEFTGSSANSFISSENCPWHRQGSSFLTAGRNSTAGHRRTTGPYETNDIRSGVSSTCVLHNLLESHI
jgi:hypothetical protein